MARYQRSYGQVIIKRKTPFGIVYTKSFSDTISIIETFFTGKELVNTPLYSDANIIQYNQFENLTAAIGTNLTNNGSVVFDAGKFNNGADFGASNTTKYLSIPISISAPSGAATFSMWVQILTQPATNASYNLMTCRTTGGGTNYVDWQIIYKDVSGTKQLYFDRSRPGVGDQGPTYNVDLGTTGFHLITFTYDGTNIHGYVDGIDQTGATAASGVGTGGTNALFLGSTNSSTGFASAKLDDFAIFSRTLTATEVKSLFTGSFGTSYTKTFTETYTLIESFIKATNKQLVDTFALVEFFIKRSSKQFNDTFAISEVYQTLRTRTVSFVDSLTILDTLTKQTQKLLVDTFTLTDSIVKQTQKVFSEVFTLIENFLAVKNGGTHNYTQTFSESIVIVESFGRSISKQLLETISLSESFVKNTSKTLLDTVSLSDIFATIKTSGKTLIDTITLSDSLGKSIGKTFIDSYSIIESFVKKLNGFGGTLWTKRSKVNPATPFTNRTKPTSAWTNRIKP